MNTAIMISFGNIEKIDAVTSGIAALLMLGIVLTCDLDSTISSILVLLSIPTMLFALMRWNPVYSQRDHTTDSNCLYA
jgi:hypothetical protein